MGDLDGASESTQEKPTVAVADWKNPWTDEVSDWPPPSVQRNASEPQEESLVQLMQGIKQATDAITNYAAGKPVLLHLGIGVGDPSVTLTDLNNPTINIADELRNWQVNPPFLADAINCGYFVAALNINYADKSCPISGFNKTDGAHIQVETRFPLGARSGAKAKEAFEQLKALMKGAARVVVVSAISQNNYGGPIDLVTAAGCRGKASYVLAAYATKYVEVRVPITNSRASMHTKLPMVLKDVFPPALLTDL